MSKGQPSDAKIRLQSEHGKEEKCYRSEDITKNCVMENDVTYHITSKAEEIGSGSLLEYEGTSTNESDTFCCDYLLNPAGTDQDASQSFEELNANYVNRLGRQIAVINECGSPSIEKIDSDNVVQDPQISIQNLMRTPTQNEETSQSQKEISCARNSAEEKYFYYEKPLYEETGMWIPVSVPPMSESEHEEWTKGICSNGGFISEGELGWDQTVGAEKELTMWDVVVEMLLVARGKMTGLTSGDVTQISWISAHVIEQAWKEMAETLTEANFSKTQEILESEPPKWLPDSLASSCMLCSVRFHPIMCTRHHCRFCGGIFCSECTKGRSLLPEKFRTRDPQRVCDVCCVRLESVQPYLMDLVSRAAQLPIHDLTDLSTLRSWVNFPWGQSMEYEIYKATNTIRSYSKVGSLGPEKRIPESILRNALGIAILTVVKVGMMVTYKIGTGLVIARREDGLWSPPSAISSFGVGWGAQAGGELTDFIIALRTNDAVKTFCSHAHLSIGAGLSAAIGIIGRTAEADIRAGPGAHAACYTYSCSKGAFIGCSLEGSVVTTRARENSRFYGSQFINASEILCGSLPRPPAAATLYRALDEMYMEIGR
ncbi:uncharacterized protein [Primulina eburnea]|uniref:uncharacterized protein n=1 Tax=Primulina eburnea TaxID=1245227 RepID=UPI003C6C3391